MSSISLGDEISIGIGANESGSACFFLREYIRKKVHQDVKEELKEIGHSEDKTLDVEM